LKQTLKLSIQIFWAVIGLLCLAGVLSFSWQFFFGPVRPQPLGVFRWLFVAPILFLFCTLIWAAYRACFRFSGDILGPTVCIVALVLFSAAAHGETHFLEPAMKIRSGILQPLLGLGIAIVVLAGPFVYYRVMLAILRTILFPELKHSAARLL
jgi:hypothetical protein